MCLNAWSPAGGNDGWRRWEQTVEGVTLWEQTDSGGGGSQGADSGRGGSLGADSGGFIAWSCFQLPG